MSLEKLRDILFEEDRVRMKLLQDELEKVRAKVANKEALITSLSPVISDLLERKIASSGDEMAEIVAPLMGPAIKKQVAESKDEVVEALYPVIGQTVRRAVAEAMRRLAQQVNQRLDKSLKLKTAWLRLRAKISGVPEPLTVLPQIFPFAIEQLFLIDQRTGLLISHTAATNGAMNGKVPHDEAPDSRLQMVSGMLTAIQDFTREAFGPNETGDLHEVKYGDKMIFVAASPPVFLAAVTVGAAPLQFPDRLRGLLRRLHNNFHQELHEFNGDVTPLEKTQEPMRKFIVAATTATGALPKAPARSAMASRATVGKILFGVAIGLALAASGWFWFKSAGETAVEQALPPSPAITPAPARPQLRLEAQFEGRVWLQAIADARDTTEFIFQKGEAYAWRADSLFNLRIGNAGETKLFLNGKLKKIAAQKDEPVTVFITAPDSVKVEHDVAWKK